MVDVAVLDFTTAIGPLLASWGDSISAAGGAEKGAQLLGLEEGQLQEAEAGMVALRDLYAEVGIETPQEAEEEED